MTKFSSANLILPSKDNQLSELQYDTFFPPSVVASSNSRVSLIHRAGSKTIRRSLEILNRQCEVVQRDRDELQKTLVQREKEIASLLRSDRLSTEVRQTNCLLSDVYDWACIMIIVFVCAIVYIKPNTQSCPKHFNCLDSISISLMYT